MIKIKYNNPGRFIFSEGSPLDKFNRRKKISTCSIEDNLNNNNE